MRHWLALAALLVSCGGGNPPPAGSDRNVGERGTALDGRRSRDGNAVDLRQLEPRPPGEFGAGGCDQPGNHLQLRYLVQQFDLNATEVKVESGAKGIIGFSGTTLDGYRFWFGREGSPDAGAFTDAKTYFATTPPYHMLLQRWPVGSGASCNGNAACETYYGLNGIFTFVTVKAPTAGSFNISQIVRQPSCWEEQPSGPPKLTCAPVGGNVYGCFKVN